MFMPECKVDIMEICKTCNGNKYSYWCSRHNHSKGKQFNVPFIVPDMQIISFGKWTLMESKKMNKKFTISRTKIGQVLVGCGVKPGGLIPNQWWKYSNIGGTWSLEWLGSLDGEYKP